jgi:hypothetical protein
MYFTVESKKVRASPSTKIKILKKCIDADKRISRIVQTYESRTEISFLREITHNISSH